MKRLAVLGSTGSIGTSTLAVVDAYPERFEVVALAAGANLECLRSQIRRYRPSAVCVAGTDDAATLAAEFDDTQVLCGENGLTELARDTDADMVVVAVVGSAGLRPTIAAVQAGKDVALANKESLVAAGDLMMAAVEKAGTRLVPVDSEHSAIFQLLNGASVRNIARLILTASGGPFRTWSRRAMETATVDDALAHPTWRMGAKISVDSATLMNKGLEVIEAHHLFGVVEHDIDVVIHPESLIHAMVESVDGTISAQLATHDMRLPIALALSWPERLPGPVARLDLTRLPALTFEAPDPVRFPAIDLARAALRAGGEMPAVLNAANEVAVGSFLAGLCPFPAVSETVADTLETWSARNRPLADIEQVLAADEEARKLAATTIVKYSRSVYGSEKRC